MSTRRIDVVFQIGVERFMVQPGEEAPADLPERFRVLAIAPLEFPLLFGKLVLDLPAFDEQQPRDLGARVALLPQLGSQRSQPLRKVLFELLQLFADRPVPGIDLGKHRGVPGQVAADYHQVRFRKVASGIVEAKPQAGKEAPVLVHRFQNDQPKRPRRLDPRRQQLPIRRKHLVGANDHSPGGRFIGRAFQVEPSAPVTVEVQAVAFEERQLDGVHAARLNHRTVAELVDARSKLLALFRLKPVDLGNLSLFQRLDNQIHGTTRRAKNADHPQPIVVLRFDQTFEPASIVGLDRLQRPAAPTKWPRITGRCRLAHRARTTSPRGDKQYPDDQTPRRHGVSGG